MAIEKLTNIITTADFIGKENNYHLVHDNKNSKNMNVAISGITQVLCKDILSKRRHQSCQVWDHTNFSPCTNIWTKQYEMKV